MPAVKNKTRARAHSRAASGHKAIGRSLRFMANNWQKPINVSDLVRTSDMSRRGFIKAFARHTGRPAGQELRRLRMEHAQKLIRRSDYNLSKISRQCGYRSANSFWVAFRNYTGVSPNEYRDMCKRRRRSTFCSSR
jgi:transcriptional regulator GlxA family with amidase domain